MKKIKLIMVLISSFFLAKAMPRTLSTYGQIKNEVNKINKREVIKLVNDLIKESSPSRMIGQPGHLKARQWIESSIKAFDPKSSGKLILEKFTPNIDLGISLYQNDFDQKVEGKISPEHAEYKKWKGFTEHMKSKLSQFKETEGVNIIWQKQGIDSSKWLIITAHYDTVVHNSTTLQIDDKANMPGANYNASGVSVALSLIKLLAQIDLNYSVKVVLLDWQGLGFLGSKHFAKTLKDNEGKVMGVINLEMLGQDSTFFDKNKKKGNMSAYVRSNSEEEKWASKLNEHGSRMNQKVQFEIKPNGFENSDNINFWEQGFLCVTYSQNWEDDFNPKLYQTSDDTPEMLNQDTLYDSYQFLAGAVLGSLLDITK